MCLFVEGCSQFMIESEDLGFTAPLGPKSMLAVVENVMFLQVFYRVTHDDMFKYLTIQSLVRETGLVASIMTGALLYTAVTLACLQSSGRMPCSDLL